MTLEQLKKSHKTKNIIFRAIELELGIRQEILTSDNKIRKIVEARQLAMYYIKKHTRFTLSEIGKLFGRDHSTVLYSVNLIKDFIEQKDKQILMKIGLLDPVISKYKFISNKEKVFKDLLESSGLDKRYWENRYKNAY